MLLQKFSIVFQTRPTRNIEIRFVSSCNAQIELTAYILHVSLAIYMAYVLHYCAWLVLSTVNSDDC